MSATAALEIGSDRWNSRVYAGLSLASEMLANLDKPKSVILTLLYQWKVYWHLVWLDRAIDGMFAGYDQAEPFPQVVPGERNRFGRDILLKLYADCTSLLDNLDV